MSNLSIEDIKVGDVVLTTSRIYYYTHGVPIIEEGKFVKILAIHKQYDHIACYSYYHIKLSNTIVPTINMATWDQLKHKIITKNKEWDGSVKKGN